MVFQAVEDGAAWPDSCLCGTISTIPKEATEESTEVKAGNLIANVGLATRPITESRPWNTFPGFARDLRTSGSQPWITSRCRCMEQLPKCFVACALVPNRMNISVEQMRLIQQSLVSIWQAHIHDWYENPENFEILHTQPPASDNPIEISQSSQLYAEVVETVIPEGGVFCCKCGKSTKLFKHQRLKILSKPCQFPDLPQSDWLTSPGAMNNAVLFEKLWHELHHKHSQAGHHYFWNQKFGKNQKQTQTYSKLWCQNCGKEWEWSQRYSNPSTKCVPVQPSPLPPQWVSDCLVDPQMLILLGQIEIPPEDPSC